MSNLMGRTAIVTGAATGIGLAIARRLASDGASVVLADVLDVEVAARALREDGLKATGVKADVTDADAVEALVAATLNEFGRIDILVNNAAISGSLRQTAIEDMALEDWRKILDVNATGVFLCCRAVARPMKAQGSGCIVNLASGTAFKGTPFILHYVASKGAVISMTRALARELGERSITVNAVAPGYTLTETQMENDEFRASQRDIAVAGRALKRDAFASDIVGAVSFLAGEDARFITGQILAVDGGSVYH
jgi:NAD(P)-dependent dehydrogenase (short-subunit alcohol dehydrogenase family)